MLKEKIQTKTLRAKAYDSIVSMLNTQDLHSGQMVTQRELVELTGTSLAAVREAIPRLEADGLLRPINQRGLMISIIDVTFLRNACQLRSIIEHEAIVCAKKNIPVTTIEDWEQEHLDILKRIKLGSTEEMLEEAQRMDNNMHSQLVDTLANEMISNIYRVNSIKVRMAACKSLLVTPYNVERVFNEHLLILSALKEQRTEDAIAAMQQHLNNSLQLALGGNVE